MSVKPRRLMVMLGRVTCPRDGQLDLGRCLSCQWFKGVVADRHPILECAYPLEGLHEDPASAAAIPGRYLG